jgi:MGT family glycosyltransferase
VQAPELEYHVRQYGLEFSPVGPSHPLDGEHSEPANLRKPSSGISALRYRLQRVISDMEMFLRETPAALASEGVDALLIDEIALSGPTVAERLHLPYFIISTSVPHNFGWSAPRRYTPPASCITRLQNAWLQISILQMRGPVRRSLNTYRREIGLGPIRERNRTFPELAHITQLPQCFDFPRSGLPPNFYYTGPFVEDETRTFVEFPWNRLDARPLVYASLGTTLKGEPATFPLIAEACNSLGLQLVISLGGRRDPATFRDLPGNPLVVNNAPQLELLERAEIVVTHAGPNTALETLRQGKPMIAIPKAFDQPAIAARLEWLGVAEVLPATKLSAEQIRTTLMKIRSEPHYRESARELQKKILSAHGLELAVHVIEDATAEYARNP